MHKTTGTHPSSQRRPLIAGSGGEGGLGPASCLLDNSELHRALGCPKSTSLVCKLAGKSMVTYRTRNTLTKHGCSTSSSGLPRAPKRSVILITRVYFRIVLQSSSYAYSKDFDKTNFTWIKVLCYQCFFTIFLENRTTIRVISLRLYLFKELVVECYEHHKTVFLLSSVIPEHQWDWEMVILFEPRKLLGCYIPPQTAWHMTARLHFCRG